MPDLAVEADQVAVAVLAPLLFTQDGIICLLVCNRQRGKKVPPCICRLFVLFSFAVVMIASVM